MKKKENANLAKNVVTLTEKTSSENHMTNYHSIPQKEENNK